MSAKTTLNAPRYCIDGAALIQSVASRSLPDDDILFQGNTFTITPSWLEIGRNSYAIRTISRLQISEVRPPQLSASLIAVASAAMMVWLVWRWVYVTLPTPMFWVLLIACLSLGVAAVLVIILQPPHYRLDIHFSGAESLAIRRKNRELIQHLHEALALAMDTHRASAVAD